jgi:hypothetical protein
MGLKCSPDISQAIMEMYCQKIDEEFIWYIWIPMTWIHMMWILMMWIHMRLWIHIYNDVGAFSTDWNHHVKLLATILCWLCQNGFTINQLKCKWAVRETDWLEFWLTPWDLYLGKKDWCHTPHGLTLQCHRTVHVHWLHKLLLYMLPSHAHILKPLTDQSGLITYFMDRQNVKCICKMHLLMVARASLVPTIINGLAYTLTPLTSS